MPPAAAPSLTRRALAGLVLVGALSLGGSAAWAQDPPPSTPTSGVLVPGSTVPATTVPPATTTSEAPASDDSGDGLLDLDANEKVWVIVGGLVAIAVLMMVLTIIYWRHTKPDRPKQDKRIDRAERRADKAELKQEKRERRSKKRDPFVPDDEDEAEDAADAAPPAGPIDIEGLLGSPDPSRSVFAEPDEDDEPSR